MTALDKAFEEWKRISKQSYLNAHEEHVARTAWLASRKATLKEILTICDTKCWADRNDILALEDK